ncbi:hypothetical protein BDN70DRAFT_916960 [Pholiota conissans]|uniref:Uncharacterized protein n=1 Tax=Pholiota conissans TaxID=109636 RepID=A0A9P5ZEL9_9AGAR|nr:hypothetical protein BDN70DRAFT_916960 [Pholiota conissans]
MLSLDARFTLLVLLCGLTTQWIPLTAVNAAAIAHHPPSARRSSVQNADYSRGHESFDITAQKQRVFPWSASHHRRNAELAKRMDNPFADFAHSVMGKIRNKFHHHKRSSHKAIAIPSNRGGAYLVDHSRRDSPLWRIVGGSSSQRRDDATQQGVAGTVAVVSHDANNDQGKQIASLFLDNMNNTYVFEASETNKTQLYMVRAPSSDLNSTSQEPTSSADSVDVLLVLWDFAGNDSYCVTYDPTPTKAAPMTAQTCSNGTSQEHSSQAFKYNTKTGQLLPTWFAGEDDGTHDTTSAQDVSSSDPSSTSSSSAFASASANVTDGARSTLSSSVAVATSTSLSTRDDFQHSTRNVTLVFVPAGSTVVVQAKDDSPTSTTASATSTSSSSISSASSTDSASASGSISAAGVDPSSSISSPSATSSSVSVSSSSSPSPSASPSVGGLSVELVGDGSLPPSSNSASASVVSIASSSTMTSMASTASSSSSVPGRWGVSLSRSINAQAIASSIAASRASSASLASASAQSSSAASASSSLSASASFSAAGLSPTDDVSASGSASIASASPSSSSSPSATSSSSSSSSSDTQASGTFVAAVVQRAAPVMTPVSTDPYQWKFRAESK